ncbi:hypothetical protein CFC21_090019 [Triticum aestivum]|uniref:Uncharacterized protein n=2 Tax=Triticum aestivum TaxID=4565 RepID=A0A3B6PRS1_WHEAT|nr:hypothetical protein CFC21_090019 [Triticum aestivum]
MASKAFPALVLLALVCSQLVVGGHAQPYIGGTRGGGGSAAGLRPPTSITTHAHSSTVVWVGAIPGGYDGTGRPSAVEEDKAFMINSLLAHDRLLPVSPSGH